MIKFLTRLILTVFLLFVASLGQLKPEYQLRLLVVEDGGTKLFPLSKYYTGTLVNDGSKAISIEAIQMPGGYQGSGRVFPCSVQVWNAQRRSWVTPHPSKLEESYPEQIVQVPISPRQEVKVCDNLLPQQAGRQGDSVRFALASRWGQPPRVFSKPFRLTHKWGWANCVGVMGELYRSMGELCRSEIFAPDSPRLKASRNIFSKEAIQLTRLPNYAITKFPSTDIKLIGSRLLASLSFL